MLDSCDGRFNKFDDGIRFIDQGREQVNQRAEGHSIRPGGMVNRYVDCKLIVELHIRRRTVKGKRSDFCAVFQAEQRAERIASLNGDGFSEVSDVCEFYPGDTVGAYPEKLVLVRIVQSTNKAQQGRDLWVRSHVRLYSLNGCPYGLAEAPDSVDLGFKIIGSVVDRKHEDAIIGGGIEKRFVDGDVVNAVVQGASQIMNTVPRNETPANKVRPSERPKDNAVSGGVCVFISEDFIRFRLVESPKFITDGIAMLTGHL
jgi:hypothetical protein